MAEEGTNDADRSAGSNPITPELVRQVADKVYALWLKELQIERERRRPLPQDWRRRPG
jgi:hypothetical protein